MAMLGPPRDPRRNAPFGPPIGPDALRFKRPVSSQAAYTFRGVSRDSQGNILPNCVVDLFYATGDKQRYSSTVSDAEGAFCFCSGDNVSTFFIVAYLNGGTPVAGTSLQTLTFT